MGCDDMMTICWPDVATATDPNRTKLRRHCKQWCNHIFINSSYFFFPSFLPPFLSPPPCIRTVRLAPKGHQIETVYKMRISSSPPKPNEAAGRALRVIECCAVSCSLRAAVTAAVTYFEHTHARVCVLVVLSLSRAQRERETLCSFFFMII